MWETPGMCGRLLECVGDFWNVWEISEMCGRFLECVGDFWNVWEISGMCGRFTKSASTTYVDEYIDFFSSIFTCLMDHNSCGRITVFRLVVLFDLI
jgi:hypothetical protein